MSNLTASLIFCFLYKNFVFVFIDEHLGVSLLPFVFGYNYGWVVVLLMNGIADSCHVKSVYGRHEFIGYVISVVLYS